MPYFVVETDGIGLAERDLEILVLAGSVSPVEVLGRGCDAGGYSGGTREVSGAAVGTAERSFGYQGGWVSGHRHDTEIGRAHV